MTLASPLRTWKGRTVHPVSETEQTVAAKVKERLEIMRDRLQGSLFFVPSPADGWGIEVLFQALPAEAAVVFLEKDPDLLPWSRERLRPLVGRCGIYWLAEDSEAAVQTLFRQLPLNQLRRCEWLTVSGSWLLAAERYRHVFQRLEAGVATHWSNRMTSLHLGPLWLRNVMDHLADPGVSPAEWPDWGQDPVVVCGAGTSLETNLAFLEKHRATFRLIAADTALPVLVQAGMVPDAVVCLEAQQVNLSDFIASAGQNIPLFLDLSAHPPTRRALSGPTYWFHTPFADLALWKRLPWSASVPAITPVGSVGVTAAALAWKLTRGQVYLAGLDFSFPLGQTHARGAPALNALLNKTDRFHPVEAVGSWLREGLRPVPGREGWLTSGVLEGYAKSLAELARVERHRTTVLSAGGLNLGLPHLNTWLHAKPTKAVTVSPGKAPATRAADTETEELKALIAAFERLKATPEEAEAWNTLSQRLTRNDHLFFFFPDPEVRFDSSFLSRVLVQARWLQGRLETRKNS